MKYFLKILIVFLLVSCINDADNNIEEDKINYEHEVSLEYFENDVDSTRITITIDNKKISKLFKKDNFIIKFSADKKSNIIIKYDVYRKDSIIFTDIDSLNFYLIDLPTVKEIQTTKKIYDTLIFNDTNFHIDTISYNDTLFSIDTIVFKDSISITVKDTLIDTLYLNEIIRDTIIVERIVIDTIYDTIIQKDTIIQIIQDTVTIYDTIIQKDTLIQIIHDTVTIHDTIICVGNINNYICK